MDGLALEDCVQVVQVSNNAHVTPLLFVLMAGGDDGDGCTGARGGMS